MKVGRLMVVALAVGVMVGVLAGAGAGGMATRPGAEPGGRRGSGTGPGTAASTNPAPLTDAIGWSRLRGVAVNHANPYIRQAAYEDHNGDWHLDVDTRTFSLDIRDPVPRTLTGKFIANTQGDWAPRFDEDDKLASPWTPPADAAFDFDMARKALVAMCADWSFDKRLSLFGDVLKNAQTQPAGDVVNIPSTTTASFNMAARWQIDLKARTFRVSQTGADTGNTYNGKFGWDKNKQWTAWPTMVMSFAGGARGARGGLAIPTGFSPPDHPATSPGTRTGG